ncbi:MAG: AAA family ATPase [Rickettsiales bacterium]|nr:AAA family ATPase [Rickettsiales bacterium]
MLDISSPKFVKKYIGSEKIINKIDDFISSEEIPQTLLFYGGKGVGKANVAYLFAKKLLSIGIEEQKQNSEIDLFGGILETSDNSKPKINQKVELKIENGNHPDLLVIELTEESEKKSISIDKIREIEFFLNHSPAESKYKIVIIDSIDDLSNQSANAILKITEEPNNNSILILISHNINSVLPTIRSRCFEIFFKNPNEKEFLEIIKNFDVEYKKELAEYSGFSAGNYLNMLKYDTEIIIKFVKKFPNVDSKDISNISSIFKEDKKDKNKKSYNYNNFKNILLFDLSKKAKSSKNKDDVKNFFTALNLFNLHERRNMDISHSIKEIIYQIAK